MLYEVASTGNRALYLQVFGWPSLPSELDPHHVIEGKVNIFIAII
jgi:hypothetical protein